MKNNKLKKSLLVGVIIAAIIIIFKNIGMLPWWSFVIPVAMLGIALQLCQFRVPYFLIGFVTGFLLWFGADLYYEITLQGNVLEKLGKLLPIGKVGIMALAGLAGGLLNGLALHTGQQLFIHVKTGDTDKEVW